ncbi:MAG: general secretion pathway protein GspB [Gammaproteobacteria bacterium]|nr:general secretion pathway protein GspB [Gammaproteobacteria bacterium]
MSYILDALKKSQQERQLGKVPTVDASQLDMEPRQPAPTRWVYSAVVLAVTAIIVAAYGVLDNKSPAPMASAPTAPFSASPREHDRAAAASAARHHHTDKPAVSAAGSQAPTPEALSAEIGIDTNKLRPGPVPFELFGAEIPGEPKTEAMPTAAVAALPAGREDPDSGSLVSAELETAVPLLRQLSSEFRQTVPAMSLDVHVYRAKPESRFVLINETLYREGEQTSEGPVVEEIAPDGAILSYQGTLFRLGT